MKAGPLTLTALAAVVAAQPHRQHHHHAAKRQNTVVVTAEVVTSVQAVVFVDPSGNPVSTSYADVAAAPTEPAAAVIVPSSYVAPAPESSAPPPPPPPAYSPSSYVPPPQPSSTQAPSSSAAPSSSEGAPAPSSSSTPSNSGSSSGYALSYSPYNSDGSCKSQDQVNNDFNMISGYDMIRIYGTDCDQTVTVGNAASAKGMKLFAGVFNVDQVSTEIQHIIDAANGNFDHIDTISIGNEGVNSGKYSVDQVVSAINTARGMLKSAGYNGKIVTVDTFVALIANPQLCEASDYAAANCHAFFDGGVTAEEAGKFVLGQAQRVSEACGGKDTMITETGWPSQGETNGKAVPSLDNQKMAIDSIKSAFSNNVILFSAFNDYWKQNNAGTYGAEQYWGILGNSP